MRFNIIIFFFIFTLFISCEEKNQVLNTPNEKEKTVDNFENKYINEPKVFLDFWANITHEEFFNIGQRLYKKGDINFDPSYSIDINGENVYINHANLEEELNYNNTKKTDSLGNEIFDGILLTTTNYEVYNVYKEKYNLKPLKKKRYLNEYRIVDNPDYYNYKENKYAFNNIKYINEKDNSVYEFIDSIQNSKLYHSSFNLNELLEEIYYLDEKQVVFKDNIVIIIYKKTSELKESYKDIYIKDNEFFDNKDLESITRNAKKKITFIIKSGKYCFFYTSKENYDNFLNKNMKEIEKNKNNLIKENQKRKENINKL